MDNSKKLLAIIVVALMALSPLAIAYGSEGASEDKMEKLGSSVEIKDVSYNEIVTALKEKWDVTVPTEFHPRMDAYVDYIGLILFPGLNTEVFHTQDADRGVTMKVIDGNKMKVNAKVDVYTSAIEGKEMKQKVALDIKIKDMSVEFSNLALDAEKLATIFNQNYISSIFCNGDYAKYVNENGLKYKAVDDKVIVGGDLELKLYIQTDITAVEHDGKKYLAEGGINALAEIQKIPFISKYLEYVGPISDVRLDVIANINLDFADKDGKSYKSFNFETDTKASAKVNITYTYDKQYTTASLKVNDVKVAASEKASIDGKSNNKIDLDLTSNVKAIFDGRFVEVASTPEMFVFEGKIGANEYFDFSKDLIPLPEPSNKKVSIQDIVIDFCPDGKATVDTDATNAEKGADAIASEINGDVPAKDNTVMIIALVAIALALVIIIALFYRQKKAKI